MAYKVGKGIIITGVVVLVIAVCLLIKGIFTPTPIEKSAEKIFAVYEDNNVYSSDDYVKINGKNYRTDCSGYVDAVLADLNIVETDDASIGFLENKELKDALSSNGFKYMKYSGAADVVNPGILAKDGLVAIVIPGNEYDEYTLYCWGSKEATVKSITAEKLDDYGFTNVYALIEE